HTRAPLPPPTRTLFRSHGRLTDPFRKLTEQLGSDENRGEYEKEVRRTHAAVRGCGAEHREGQERQCNPDCAPSALARAYHCCCRSEEHTSELQSRENLV